MSSVIKHQVILWIHDHFEERSYKPKYDFLADFLIERFEVESKSDVIISSTNGDFERGTEEYFTKLNDCLDERLLNTGQL